MKTAPAEHPLAISTPFSNASLHRFEEELKILGMHDRFDRLLCESIAHHRTLEHTTLLLKGKDILIF